MVAEKILDALTVDVIWYGRKKTMVTETKRE